MFAPCFLPVPEFQLFTSFHCDCGVCTVMYTDFKTFVLLLQPHQHIIETLVTDTSVGDQSRRVAQSRRVGENRRTA